MWNKFLQTRSSGLKSGKKSASKRQSTFIEFFFKRIGGLRSEEKKIQKTFHFFITLFSRF